MERSHSLALQRTGPIRRLPGAFPSAVTTALTLDIGCVATQGVHITGGGAILRGSVRSPAIDWAKFNMNVDFG
jgi:hypothetical protein